MWAQDLSSLLTNGTNHQGKLHESSFDQCNRKLLEFSTDQFTDIKETSIEKIRIVRHVNLPGKIIDVVGSAIERLELQNAVHPGIANSTLLL